MNKINIKGFKPEKIHEADDKEFGKIKFLNVKVK